MTAFLEFLIIEFKNSVVKILFPKYVIFILHSSQMLLKQSDGTKEEVWSHFNRFTFVILISTLCSSQKLQKKLCFFGFLFSQSGVLRTKGKLYLKVRKQNYNRNVDEEYQVLIWNIRNCSLGCPSRLLQMKPYLMPVRIFPGSRSLVVKGGLIQFYDPSKERNEGQAE